MSTNRLFDSGPIVVTGTPGFSLDGILSGNTDTGLTEILQSAGGQVDPSFVATMNNIPVQSVVVTDIATLLANIGFSGMDFRSTATNTIVDKHFLEIEEGGERVSGPNATFKVRMSEGIGIFTTIDSRINESAQASVEFHPTFDGTNDPYVYTANIALPSGTNEVTELFTLGGVLINGVQVDSVQGVSIDSGIELVKKITDGQVFPTFVGIMARQPRITVNTDDVELLNTLGISGSAITTNATIFLRKMDEDGTRVADGTAQHISFVINQGKTWIPSIGGGNNTLQEGTVIIQPTFSTPGPIVVVSTTATIAGIT